MIAVTDELLERLQRRTVFLLAGLGVPQDGGIYKTNADGSATLERKPPPLPGGRELLAQMLHEGRPVTDRFVVAAKEAAIAELLTGYEADGGKKE
jgi:hypothetical protein